MSRTVSDESRFARRSGSLWIAFAKVLGVTFTVLFHNNVHAIERSETRPVCRSYILNIFANLAAPDAFRSEVHGPLPWPSDIEM